MNEEQSNAERGWVELGEAGASVRGWVRDVPLDDKAREQLRRIARLPFVHGWVAAMPDVHVGIGATVGSVIPTRGAIVPAAVGVDLGCGMQALRTSLCASDLPDNLRSLRSGIEKAVPHGRSDRGGRNDQGSWRQVPKRHANLWRQLEAGYRAIVDGARGLDRGKSVEHLGTLGSGNHFIELCLDEEECQWVMLHSGSRGPGNRIGQHFIQLAKKDLGRALGELPDEDLAYFEEGAEHFDAYVSAVDWAQDYARANRQLMMEAVLEVLKRAKGLPRFQVEKRVVDCHHNYVEREQHFGAEVWVTRKGAVSAREGELGIIPGSMGARSYIVRGRGNPDSFHSCSHGAGRAMSRAAARRRFGVEEHAAATAAVECRKDEGVIDETPMAYKPIESVMAAQSDLVQVVHELRQVVCIKG